MIASTSKPGLVVYVTCGDPNLDVSREVIIAAIDAEASQGFIYAVSRTGVTGPGQIGDNKNDAIDLVKRLRKFSKLPIAVGFGISSAADFRSVGAFADAAVVGSAIVGMIEKSAESGDSPAQTAALVSKWISELRRPNNAEHREAASRARG